MFAVLILHPGTVAADTEKTDTEKIAILPFKINSQNKIVYIRDGIFDMLTSRLAWKDHIVIASPMEMQDMMADISADSYYPDRESLLQIAAVTKSNYIVYGSLTEFADAFSLDTTIFNTETQTSQAFFTQAETLDQIISGVEIVAAQINIKIFNRKTSALALLQKDIRKDTQDIIRANPEKLMRENGFPANKEKRPFWKFWGNDNEDEDEDEDENLLNPLGAEQPNGNKNATANSAASPPQTIEQMEEKKGSILLNTEMDVKEAEDKENEEKKPFWKFW